MEEALQAEAAENEVPLYITPRRKKNVNYTGNVLPRKNYSDSDTETKFSRSKRRKMDPPSHKKRKLVSKNECSVLFLNYM